MARQPRGPALPPALRRPEPPGRDPPQRRRPVAGPALPPGYKSSSSEASDSEADSECSPPPHAGASRDSEEERDSGPTPRKRRCSQETDDEGFFGPALPPGFKKEDDSPPRPIIGPALPPGFQKTSQSGGKNRDDREPPVPSDSNSEASESSEDDEMIVGPMPAKGPFEFSVAEEFERRAQRMKDKLTSGDDDGAKPVTRESWMTELPPELKGFGLGPRTFKRRAEDKSGDRSIWTDTPADRERKAKETQDAKKSISKDDEERVLSGRDKRLAEQVSSYNEDSEERAGWPLQQKGLGHPSSHPGLKRRMATVGRPAPEAWLPWHRCLTAVVDRGSSR
ncbi:GPALPP motifs-containing protein 1 isoform X2 [Ornithorhynchus anatinus]|uniref:GPALPP motifs-containing protein 1 isoform X2 n=1 Tax=Ornithorhynchus anatinus TaxID=9258 RepID=UPI0010A930D6|nr:GPALPP motifs-containing protein 1 isoform X2 [Ornithorhynchus anatinus]